MKKVLMVALLVLSTINANAQNISTIAGTGVRGYSGDGGLATRAKITAPGDVSVYNGNVYFSDPYTFKIRKITRSGIVTTIAGNGSSVSSGDGGPATNAGMSNIYTLTVDAKGSLVVADDNVVRKIDTFGIITTIAGNAPGSTLGDGGAATNAQFNTINGLCFDNTGNLFISDCGHHRIRKVDTFGIITTIAGTGVFGSSGDGGPATNGELMSPCGLCADQNGNIYVADLSDIKIRKVSTDGIITTLAGTGTFGTSGNGGPATGAEFETPVYLAYNARNGDISVSDGGNAEIRTIHLSGVITAFVGTGVSGYGGDGGPATDARINAVRGIAYDEAGDFYICDVENDRVRKVVHDPTAVPVLPQESAEEGTIIVYDLRGAVVWVENKNHYLDENLPNGAYIYTLVGTKSGRVLVRKQITIIK